MIIYLKEIAISPAAQNYAAFLGNDGRHDLVTMLEYNVLDGTIEEAQEYEWEGWEQWSELKDTERLAAIAAYNHLDKCDLFDLKTGEGIRREQEISDTQIVYYLDYLQNSVSPDVGAVPGEIFGLKDVSVYLD